MYTHIYIYIYEIVQYIYIYSLLSYTFDDAFGIAKLFAIIFDLAFDILPVPHFLVQTTPLFSVSTRSPSILTQAFSGCQGLENLKRADTTSMQCNIKLQVECLLM